MPSFEIKEVSGFDLAFGGNMQELLPAFESIPQEFRNMNGRTKWNELVSDWFYCGLNKLELKPKEGIDENKALRHIKAILGSFEPKHEHKIAGCAYLLSLWFEDVQYERKTVK